MNNKNNKQHQDYVTLKLTATLTGINTTGLILTVGLLSLSSSQGQKMSSGLQLDVRHHIQWRRHLVNAYEVKRQAWCSLQVKSCVIHARVLRTML